MESTDLDIVLNDYKSISVIYQGVGNNLDLINNYSYQKQININYIYRQEDLNNWDYAKLGYNKFKSSSYSCNKIKSRVFEYKKYQTTTNKLYNNYN